MTVDECDECLKALSLTCAAPGTPDEDTRTKLDLYHSLFAREGMTRDMLRLACAAFATAPTKGRQKWFPDPGTLLEIVSEQARNRKRSLGKFRAGLDLLEGRTPVPQEDNAEMTQEMRERMRAMVEKMTARQEPAPPPANDARGMPAVQRASDPASLLAALERRTGRKFSTTKAGEAA